HSSAPGNSCRRNPFAMKPLQASSGDLIADRRADFAEMLHAAGDHAPAADLMLEALALAPGWAAGWFLLGEMQEAAGRIEQAALAWNKALALDPSDRLGHLATWADWRSDGSGNAALGLRRDAVRPVCRHLRCRAGRETGLPRAGAVVRSDPHAGRAHVRPR